MAKIWFDLCTPKETNFFNVLIKEFKSRGYETLLTSREYPETNDLIRYLGLNAYILGSHGATKAEKLKCGIDRLKKLNRLILKEKPDTLVTLTNPEACRIAYGLGMPVNNFTDMPEADKVMRLTLPLSTNLFCPFHVPMDSIRRYWDGPVFFYQCLDPVAWMPESPKSLDEIFPDIEMKRPFIVYREGENRAAYLEGRDDITHPIINHLKHNRPNGIFFEVPRYSRHKMIDMQSLLAYPDLFIGGGGTMTTEAAWWGTWTIACRPVIATYDRWLEEHHLQFRAHTIVEGMDLALELLTRKEKNKNAELLRKQKFPLKEICDIIAKV